MDIMFDSNAFDNLKDNLEVILNSKKNNKYYMTYVQERELKDIPKEKEQKMNDIFMSIEALKVKKEASSVFIIGHTPIGSGRLGNGKIYEELLNESKNNVNDAIIGETAISYGFDLVTNDGQLYNKVKKYGIKAMTFDEFLNEL